MPPSSIAGVCWIEKSNTYHANARFNKRSKYIGSFKLESEAAAAIAKFKIDGISPVKPPVSLIKGVSKARDKWRAMAPYQGGPVTDVGSSYETEEEAGAAITKFKNDGIKPTTAAPSIPGVQWVKKSNKYQASAQFDGKQTYLGMHELVSEAVAAIAKFKNDGIGPPLKLPASLIKGVSKRRDKWLAKASYQGGPKTVIGSSYETEEDAGAAITKFTNDGIKPSCKPTSSLIEGVWKSATRNKWGAMARYQGGPRTLLGHCYTTEEDAAAAVLKFEEDGIKPAKRKYGITPLDINICPGATGCQTPCDNRSRRCLWSFHNERGELIGVCCSKLCLDQRYQSPVFLETVAQFKENKRSKRRADHQSHLMRQLNKQHLESRIGPKKGISKYKHVYWSSVGPGRWEVSLWLFGGKKKAFADADEDDAARWYNSEAPRLGRPLIEGVPDAPVYSLNETLKRHLV